MHPHTQTPNPETQTPSANVVFASRARVDAELTALNKRNLKRGLPALVWTWGAPFVSREHIPMHLVIRERPGVRIVGATDRSNIVEVERIPLYLPDALPVIEGWRFVAAFEHEEGGTLVSAVPGETVPEHFRTRGMVCDHCRSHRTRNQTFVLRRDTAACVEYKQVGSTCIRDFLGNSAPANIAWLASEIAALPVRFAGIDDDMLCNGRGASGWTLSTFLAATSAVIRASGWISRGMTEQTGGKSTSDYVLEGLDRDEIDIRDSDRERADAALAWAHEIAEEGASDYLHNVRVVARGGFVNAKRAGIAASIIRAWERATADAATAETALPSVHVGNVGERLTLDATIKRVHKYEAPSYYGRFDVTIKTIVTFQRDDGAILCWFASNSDLDSDAVGTRVRVTGTVKAHGDYKGTPQTTLTRCKVVKL